MSEHPNAARARDGLRAVRPGRPAGTARPLRRRCRLACPRLDGAQRGARGRDAIVAFLRGTAELTGGTYRVELLWTVADDGHLVAVYRAVGERPDGRELDVEQALLVELEHGRWKVVRAQPLDQAAFDAFWND